MSKQGIYRLTLALFVGLIVCGSSISADILVSTGVRLNAFKDDFIEENDGNEITFPVSLVYTRKRFSLSLISSYSRALIDEMDQMEYTLAGFTDTLVSAAYTIPELPFGLFCMLGVNVNLPSGKEALTSEEEQAISDDLFEVAKFGEGFNLGMNFSVMRQFGNVTLGMNGMYTYKGKYDPTRDVPDDDLDPGDQVLVSGVSSWKLSPQINFSALAAYSYIFQDKIEGEKDFQQGGSLTIGGTLQYTRKPAMITLSVQDMIPQKNKEWRDGKFQAEPENSNRNMISALLDVTYASSQKLTFGLTGDIQYFAESLRKDEESALPYEGEKRISRIGPRLRYALTNRFAIQALTRYIQITEKESVSIPQEVTYYGVAANFEVSYVF